MRENDRIRSIGILSYKIDSPRYTGRRSGYGNIIKVGDNIAIITAAHCVYEIGVDKFNIDMNFSTVYGSLKDHIPIESAIIHKNWGINHEIGFDTAVLIPQKGSYDFKYYYDIASSIKETFQFEENIELSIAYIKGLLIKKSECINVQGRKEFIYGNKMIGVEFKGKRGLSGSPWFFQENGEWKQIALTSSKLKSQKNMLWGPEWGEEMVEISNYIQGKGLDDQNLMIQKIKQERRNGI